MSLATTLLNLRILSKVSGGGRIAKSCNGVISLEDASAYLCIKRWLMWDSRHQTLQEIKRILDDAAEKCCSMLHSRYITADGMSDESVTLMEEIKMLHQGLLECTTGLKNLRITYCQDQSTVAQIDLMVLRVHSMTSKLNPYVELPRRTEATNNSTQQNCETLDKNVLECSV